MSFYLFSRCKYKNILPLNLPHFCGESYMRVCANRILMISKNERVSLIHLSTNYGSVKSEGFVQDFINKVLKTSVIDRFGMEELSEEIRVHESIIDDNLAGSMEGLFQDLLNGECHNIVSKKMSRISYVELIEIQT